MKFGASVLLPFKGAQRSLPMTVSLADWYAATRRPERAHAHESRLIAIGSLEGRYRKALAMISQR